MTDTPDYVTASIPYAPVHQPPARTDLNLDQVTQQQLDDTRGRFLEMIWQQLVLAFNKVLLPGPAYAQLQSWSQKISDDLTAAGSGNWDALLGDLGLADVPGLATYLDTASARAQQAQANWTTFLNDLGRPTPTATLINDALTALFGGTTVTPTVQVEAIPAGIPYTNVNGILGLNDIGNALQQATTSLLQGLTNTADPALGFAQVANAANSLLSIAENALGMGQANSHAIAQQAVAKPTWHALDPTVDGTFNLTSNAGTSAPTIGVAYGNSVMSIIPTPNAMTKTSFVWLGYGATNITGAYVNLYKINPTTGALTKVWASANVVSSLPPTSAGLGWVYVSMPNLAVAQGDVYMGELVIIGTGTHTLVGLTHWLPANPNIHPQQLGATRASVTAPTYETIGAGGTGNGTIVEQQTISASATAVLVDVATGVVPTSVKWGTAADGSGGTAMTLLAQAVNGGLFLCQYGLLNPATGTKNVAAVVSGAGAFAALNSIGYDGVTAFGPSTTANGNSSAPEVDITSSQNGELIHAGFGSANTGTGFTSYAVTPRYNKVGVGSVNYSLLMGDSPGSSSGTVPLWTTAGGGSWAAVATRLIGAVAPVPATITSPTYSQTVPWFGLSGLAQASQMAPATEQYQDAGAFTFIIPAWMKQGDLIDLIGVGGGKGGQGEYGTPTAADGGEAGHWNARTLVFGTDIPLSTTQITGVVGSGGAGTISFFTEGNNGTATTFSANGSTLLTCAPGTLAIAGSNGGSPGYLVWPADPDPAAKVYYGGTGAGAGSPGSPPGSGGGGAYPFVVYSGAGATGGAWIRTRQP